MKVELIETKYGQKLGLFFPYNKELVNQIKELEWEATHRTWNPEDRCWTTDIKAFPILIDDGIITIPDLDDDVKIILSQMYPEYFGIELEKHDEGNSLNTSSISLPEMVIEEDKPDCNLLVGRTRTTITINIKHFPLEELQDELSFEVVNYEFSQKYQDDEWNGKKCLLTVLNEKELTFRTGLLNRVTLFLSLHDITYDLKFSRRWAKRNVFIYENNVPYDRYPHQKKTLEAMIDAVSGIIEVAMGGGKTVIMADIIDHLKLPANVYIDVIEVWQQLYDDLGEYLGRENVGRIGEGIADIKQGVNIILLPTAYLAIKKYKTERNNVDEKTKKIYDAITRANISIYDEGHSLGAPTFYYVSEHVMSKYNFLFSATPYRMDNADLMLEAGCGEKIVQYGTRQLLDENVLMRAEVEMYKLPSVYVKPSMKFHQIYPIAITKNELRNKLIVLKALEYVSERRPTVILVEHKSHGSKLDSMLQKLGVSSIFLYHKATSHERKDVIEKFKKGEIQVIVTTLFRKGVNIPEMEGLIRAKGLGKNHGNLSIDVVQTSGRVIRKNEGKRTPKITDFYDNTIKVVEHSRHRMQTYDALGFTVKFFDKTICLEDVEQAIARFTSTSKGVSRCAVIK